MTGPSVLIVEDHPVQRAFIARALSELGLKSLFQASDGHSALAVLAENHVDLVMTDLFMPGMDGIRFIRELSTLEHPPALAIMSSLPSSIINTVRKMALEVGLNTLGAFTKPLTYSQLSTLIGRIEAVYAIGDKDTDLISGIGQQSKERLLTAMTDGELMPYFQPKINLKTGYIDGLEALIRWQHPEHGLLLPGSFLPSIEMHELDLELTLFVLSAAVVAQQRWDAQGKRFNVAINLPARLLDRSMLVEEMLEVVRGLGSTPERITIELTETSIPTEPGAYFYGASRLRMQGFGLAIDDFGQGYGSIYHLISGPFTELKVDRQLVVNATEDRTTRAALESCVMLGRHLGLYIVAEGVRSMDELELVKSMGVDAVQCHMVQRPVLEDDVLTLDEQPLKRLRN